MSVATVISALGGWRGYALALAAGVAIGGLATGFVQGAIDGARLAAVEKQHADDEAAQARMALSEIVRLSNLVAGIDADNLKELQNVQAQNDKLRADVRSGALRLSVPIARPASGDAARPAGLGDAAARAELDDKDAETLLAIVGDGDRAIVKLTACQAYARAVSTPRPSEAKAGAPAVASEGEE